MVHFNSHCFQEVSINPYSGTSLTEIMEDEVNRQRETVRVTNPRLIDVSM